MTSFDALFTFFVISTFSHIDKPAELATTTIVSTGLKYALIDIYISITVSNEMLYELVIV